MRSERFASGVAFASAETEEGFDLSLLLCALAGVAIITTATRKQLAIPAKLVDLESIKPRLTVIEYAAISQFCGKMAFKYIIGLAGSFPWL